MFNKTAQFYDKIYVFKDYAAEAAKLIALIREQKGSGRLRLLDVACGTGMHIYHLKDQFQVEGLDVSPDLIELAARRNPEVEFHQVDMIDFDLGRTYDVVACLFSSIGYVRTLKNLRKAIRSMARHLLPDGVLVIEPWFTPAQWNPGTVHMVAVDEPELKVVRMNTSQVRGRLSILDLHYLVGTPQGTQHFVERHQLGLFEQEEMKEAIAEAGMRVTFDEAGLTGRGLYVGRRER
ncbi:MAG: class I SAM-dependent methyltransferase [Anaerolineales bacterium]|jgi:SAM-dependent methyltransferase